jgi:hypothetical protein
MTDTPKPHAQDPKAAPRIPHNMALHWTGILPARFPTVMAAESEGA